MAMAARAIDDDPQLAHEHAQAAMRHAGRVGVVRETLAITAYATGDFALALRELRTVRRITGRNDHIAMIVDSERGVGRPEKALEEGRGVDRESLEVPQRVELSIALSGARLDLGQTELALHELDIPEDDPDRAYEWSAGLFAARAAVLEDLGRTDEAADWARRAQIAGDVVADRLAEDDTVVIDEIVIRPPRSERDDEGSWNAAGAAPSENADEAAPLSADGTEGGEALSGAEEPAIAGANTEPRDDEAADAGESADVDSDEPGDADAGEAAADADAAVTPVTESGDANAAAGEPTAGAADAGQADDGTSETNTVDEALTATDDAGIEAFDADAPIDDASIEAEVAELLAEAGIVDDEDPSADEAGPADDASADAGAEASSSEETAASDDAAPADTVTPDTATPVTDAPEDDRPDGALF
ncbi:hypothetical protein [Microbacterium karelineae]|uniref:hypothetical protein n=1 Tax=Microbacterium karelineae TaxID=2654283 RepID=UPI001E5E8A1F|nr:hypothetical protein [Microbacterium karelineae]